MKPFNDADILNATTRTTAVSGSEPTAPLEQAGLLAALEDSVIVGMTDLRGRITDVNRAFCAISGYTREELLGQNHRLLNSGRHPRTFWTQMWKTAAGGGVWRAEVCNRAKDGSEYWVDSTVGSVRDAAGRHTGYVSVRVDITERKQYEMELASARDQAQAANRAKDEFLANMSHEIRTPMTAILGYAELLRDEAGLDARTRVEALDTICRTGKHLLTVINDILDLSKIEAGCMRIERSPTRIAQVLGDIDRLLHSAAAAKGVGFKTRLEGAIPSEIYSDPIRLKQAALNLAANAVKFTADGEVTVTAGRGGGLNCPTLVIDVTDTGPGLTTDQAAVLFRPFSQAESAATRQHGGTGLGLTICRKIARLLGGDATLLRTQPGVGSCFRLEVPLDPVPGCAYLTGGAENSPVPAEPQPRPEVKLSGRVLLAEDGVENQRLIAFILRKAGADVAIADNGEQALVALLHAAAQGSPYELLLTDMQMPGMDGYTLAQRVRSEWGTQRPAVIALTAHAMAEDRAKCIAAGCDDYLSKPIERNVLLESCSKWMSKRRRCADDTAPLAAPV